MLGIRLVPGGEGVLPDGPAAIDFEAHVGHSRDDAEEAHRCEDD